MPATYEPIATQTLGSAAAKVTFSSISGTYTDIYLVANVKGSGSVSNRALSVQYNADTSSNYSQTTLYGEGSAGYSFRQSSQTSAWISGAIPLSTSSFFPVLVSFNNYSNATTYKSSLSRWGELSQIGATIGLWRSTAAINRIDILISGDQIAAGSTFTLYGIAAA